MSIVLEAIVNDDSINVRDLKKLRTLYKLAMDIAHHASLYGAENDFDAKLYAFARCYETNFPLYWADVMDWSAVQNAIGYVERAKENRSVISAGHEPMKRLRKLQDKLKQEKV